MNPSITWVAQFHDPWVSFAHDTHASGLSKSAASFLERQVVLNADAVLLATDEARDAYVERYAAIPASKFGVLPNGYDPIDFPNVAPSPPGNRRPLRFVHVGTIYGGRNPLPFVRGLASLVETGFLSPGSVEVEFIGDCEPAASIQAAVEGSGLGRSILFTRQVDHPEALRRMMAADVLLLLAQQQPLQIPAKLYEYLHTGRFVLAFTEGATARLVERVGAGQVVGPQDDVPAVLRRVVELHRGGLLMNRPPAEEDLRAYQAPELAARLAQLMERLVAARQSVASNDRKVQ
jgi:glycosyltransferase involved in cell wall biosynthesis